MYSFRFKRTKLFSLAGRLQPHLHIPVTKNRLARWFLPSLFAAGAIVAVVVGIVLNANLAFAVVAAVAASLSAALAWRGGKQQRQIASDLRRLAELTETSLEEARAQRPEPAVSFVITGNESATSVRLTRKHVDRAVAVEGVIENERQQALATLPSQEPTAGRGEKRFGGLGFSFADRAKAAAELGIAGFSEAERRANFEAEIEKYVARLRAWIEEFEHWRKELSESIHVRLCFENSGRVPTYGARVDVHFPDPFEPMEEELTLSRAPSKPRFKRNTGFGGLTGLDHLVAPGATLRPSVALPPQRNVSRPHVRKGSARVDIEIKKLLHGIPEHSDLITLRVGEDGVYLIPWEIRAENLPEPAHGELEFTIDTVQEEGPPITTLDELLELIENRFSAE
jgi:hypothetical protein